MGINHPSNIISNQQDIRNTHDDYIGKKEYNKFDFEDKHFSSIEPSILYEDNLNLSIVTD